MKKNIWCRLKIDDDKYHYVYVDKQTAMILCIKQGYEINIEYKDVPEEFRREYGFIK